MIANLELFDKFSPKLLMFCGKGGVGKTTMATATAFHFAKKGKKTLLISSDPSPSISDILEIDVLGKIVSINGVPNLEAAELDYDTIIELWKEKFGDEVFEILSTFLPVDKDIIDYVARAPGIDYEFALSYIYDIHRTGKYDTIIWDMAPAGGTLSLISLQEKFYNHLGEAEKLYIRIKHSLNKIKGKKFRDPLKLISEWEDLSRNVLGMLKDSNSKAVIVTIPEGLGVKQTFRIVDDFRSYAIDVLCVIINYVLKDDVDSDFLLKRKQMQGRYIKEITEYYKEKMPIMFIPLLPYEIKGIDNIWKMENELFDLED
jgi:arsenite-transporting ATPase